MKKTLLLVLGCVVGLYASGDPIVIGTGGQKGNYYGMALDMVNYCKNAVGTDMQVLPSSGSVENVNGLIEKKFTHGIVQSDVLNNLARTNPREVNQNNMKVIAALHTETIHLLVPKSFKPKAKDQNLMSKFFGKEDQPVEVDLNTLKGETVISFGGSFVSTQALNYFFDLNWDVQSVEIEKMAGAQVPIVLVGGTPYKPVEDIMKTGKWKLISINFDSIKDKAPFYVKSDVTYNINGESISVKSIGVQALFIGKNYRSEAKNAASIKLAGCVEKSLGDLADDSKTNPNWNSVYENNKQGNLVNWAYFSVK